MSSTRNSKNLLTNVFRPAYVYDASGFHTSLVLSNVATVDADTLKTGTLAIGDQGGNIYVGSNSGVPYDTNSTNFNNVALGVGAAGGISNVSNSVFIGSNAGLALTNASDTTIIGTNDTVIGTRNVVIGSRDFVFGDNNVIIGSDLSTNESYRLNIGNLILGDISLGGNLQFNANVVISGTLQCDAFNAGALDTSNLVVPGYVRNAAGATPATMDISGGNFRFSGTSFSRVSDVSFYRGRVDASAGIFGIGYDLSSGLKLTGDISGGGKVSAVNFFGTPSASNNIGGVTLNSSNISYGGTITGTTDNTSNKIGGVTLNSSNISYGGTITGTTDNTSNKIGGVTLNNTRISAANGIVGTNFDLSAGLNVTGDISGSGRVSASNFFGSLSASNSIGGVTLNNTRIGAASGIAGTNFDLSSGLRLTGDISGSGRVSASNFFGSLSASNSIGGVVLANGNLLTVSGTVSVPSHTFSTDSSMGMYYVGSQALGFSVGGSNRMTICGDRVAVNTSNPVTRFQVNPTVAVAAVKTYDSNAAMVVQTTRTSTTVLNDPTPVLYLGREGTGGQAYGSLATMNLCRWENNSVNSRTRMDLALTHGEYNDVNIMSIRSDGRVGIGTTTPATALDVSGDISGTNITYTGTISNSTTSSSNRIGGIVLSNGNVRSDPIDTFMVAGLNIASSNIVTSPDGITWTSRASPFTLGVNGVAWNGSLWVASGLGTTRIATSTDGVTWTAQTSPFGTNSYVAAWNGSIWVAGGSGATRLATSSDGITWTGRTHPGSGAVWGVAWNGSIWVAVDDAGGIATSSDGINWTAQTSPFTAVYKVAWNGSLWVAVGSGTNTIATSTDGITWTGRGTSTFSTVGNAVAWNGSLWVAVGSGTNTIATSTDGITWTGQTSPFTTTGVGVAWNGSLWVATGSGTNTIATSSDGITWTGSNIGTVRGIASRRYVLPLINSSISLLSNGTIATTNAIIGSNSATSNSIGGVTLRNSNVLTGSGSVSVPSQAFSTDASLGLYRVGANILGFASAGSNRMTISNANVGIGTTTPTTALVVVGDVSATNVTLTGRIITGDATSNKLGGITLDTNNITTTGRITTGDATSNKLGGITLDTNNITTTGRIITGSGGSNTVGGVILSNTQIITTGAINTGDATSNKLGGISLDTNNLWVPGLITGTTDNTSNKIGGVVLSNTNIFYSGRISNTVGDTSNVIGNIVISNGAVRVGNGSVTLPSLSFINDTSAGIFRSGTDIFSFVTAGSNRMTVFGSNIGIGVAAPSSTLQIGTPVTAIYSGNPLSSNQVSIIGPARASPTYAGTSDMNATLWVSTSNAFASNTGASIALASRSYDFGGGELHQTWARLTGVSPGANYAGNLIIETNSNGSLRERMRISEVGGVGIGTSAPVYQLDVSTIAGIAAINMNTWSRVSVSNVLIMRNVATSSGYVGTTVNFASVLQSIDTTLATVVSSNTTNGSSIVIQKSGIWSISWHVYSATSGVYSWVDVSTGNASGTAYNTAGSPVIAFMQQNGNNPTLNWTGYLPSNSGFFYKPRVSATPGNLNIPLNFIMTFIAETPASASTYPF